MISHFLFSSAYPYGETDYMIYVNGPSEVYGIDFEPFSPVVFNGGNDNAGSIRGNHRIRVQRANTWSPWKVTAEIKPLTSKFF
jgi:hypothetical protein